MKKLILALFIALTAVACGPSKEADKKEAAPMKEEAAPTKEEAAMEAKEDTSAAMADTTAAEEAPAEEK